MKSLVLVLAAFALIQFGLASTVLAQPSLWLQRKYDLGVSRYSEGLDFYGGYLWHTTGDTLYRLDPKNATDTDGDGDRDLPVDESWVLTHSRYSESSVWLDDQLYNFTYRDGLGNLSTDIYRLDLLDDGTVDSQEAGSGLSTTNWGSCRDVRDPGGAIIYTGHYDNLLMWFDPESSRTTRTVAVGALDWIEDLAMDRRGNLWASSFHEDHRGLHRIDPETGELLQSYPGPDGLDIIDGLAVRASGDFDLMYVTGKHTQFIWEYLVLDIATGVEGNVPAAAVELHPNYPNPFNPTTTIAFSLQRALRVRLDVYGLDGQHVRSLVDDAYGAGTHSAAWNGKDDGGRAVASGAYVYRLVAGRFVESGRMVLVR